MHKESHLMDAFFPYICGRGVWFTEIIIELYAPNGKGSGGSREESFPLP